MIDVSFQLKGSAVTVVVLALIDYQPNTLKQALQEKIDQSPQFFINSPLLISFDKLEKPESISECESLLALCRDLGLQPLGFSAVPDELLSIVKETGLAILPGARERALKTPDAQAPTQPEQPTSPHRDTATEEAPKDEAPKDMVSETPVKDTMVIARPVRSGQQIYAEGCDLIILSQVSEGAEVIADGNIHIYGALRGRALAGVHGNSQARIFCQSLEAELVSINGDFILKDSFTDDMLKKPAQVYFSGDTMLIEKLPS